MTSTDSTLDGLRFAPRVERLEGAPTDVGELLARLAAAGARRLVALDSAGGRPRRWSLVAFEPLALSLSEALGTSPSIAGLRALLSRLRPAARDSLDRAWFRGGFLGALSYDLGVAGERAVNAAPERWRQPLVVGGLYVDWVVVDHERDEVSLVLGDEPGDDRPSLALRRDRWRAALEDGRAPEAWSAPAGPLVRDTRPELHRSRIEEVRERIARGDFYQANLAHRFQREMSGTPLDLYRRLREVNAAPYAAYVEWDEATCAGGSLERGALMSASPELLLEVEAGAQGLIARTRPIKGTAPRHADPALDRRSAEGLLASEKDRAELAMIVDLERNDLGRVARAGGVRVTRFAHLESYAAVHHLTADVVAELEAGRDALDVLAALFPGGSITGAPKLASMAAIAELEGEGRGFFTGSAGAVGLDGRAVWNVLIRTLVWRPRTPYDGAASDAPRGEACFHVGGGITWSSRAADEELETMHKAAALLSALEGTRR